MVLKSIDNGPQLMEIKDSFFNQKILGLDKDFDDELEQWIYHGNSALAAILNTVENPGSIIYARDINIDDLSFTFDDIDGKSVRVSLKHKMGEEDFSRIILNKDSITKEYECDLFKSDENLFLNLTRYTLNNGLSELTRYFDKSFLIMELVQGEYSATIKINNAPKNSKNNDNYQLPDEREFIGQLMTSVQLPVSVEELYELIGEITGTDLDESSITITVTRINAKYNREETINMLSFNNGFLETYEVLIMLSSGKIYRLTAYKNGEFQASCINLCAEECEGYQLGKEAQKTINDKIKTIKGIGKFKPKKDQP